MLFSHCKTYDSRSTKIEKSDFWRILLKKILFFLTFFCQKMSEIASKFVESAWIFICDLSMYKIFTKGHFWAIKVRKGDIFSTKSAKNHFFQFLWNEGHIPSNDGKNTFHRINLVVLGFYTPPNSKHSQIKFRFKIQIVRNLLQIPPPTSNTPSNSSNTITSSPNTTRRSEYKL